MKELSTNFPNCLMEHRDDQVIINVNQYQFWVGIAATVVSVIFGSTNIVSSYQRLTDKVETHEVRIEKMEQNIDDITATLIEIKVNTENIKATLEEREKHRKH